ncbi:hypothetical protein HU200_053875 [Digitaria exilis]|uniref:Amidase domain-containing protein n=1 Tax=Digitaria exilis TaxID=1010633 RepID=A0A835AM96_9POAL|nr:hypothetical protein HU200_053875 [Digitaria exilis]
MTCRRLLLTFSVIAVGVSNATHGFHFEEATIASIHHGFNNGSLTSVALIRYYLDQIARLNPLLHAVIEVSPDALLDAARADAERASRHRRATAGGLHGIPVLLKDLIATRDRLNTTAGSFALLGSVVRRDAGVVARLRRAGAVVLGKTNLPEQHGAIVIENLDITNLSIIQNITKSGFQAAVPAEFKFNLNNYLSNLSYSPVRSLAEVIAFNNAHPVEEKLKQYGQQLLLLSENTTGIGPRERAAIHQMTELSANGVEKLMKKHQLDAIFTPDSSVTTVLAYNGLPGIEVPAGYDEKGVPFGICFGGLKGYEPRLIEMAYAFEQATKVRKPPMIKV